MSIIISQNIVLDCYDILLDLSDDGYECIVLNSSQKRISIIIKSKKDSRPPLHHESDSIGRLKDYLELNGLILYRYDTRYDIYDYDQWEYIFK